MFEFLYPVIKQRMARGADKERERNVSCIWHYNILSLTDRQLTSTKNDGIQWLIDTTPKRESWSTERLVGEILAVWFASVYTLSMES